MMLLQINLRLKTHFVDKEEAEQLVALLRQAIDARGNPTVLEYQIQTIKGHQGERESE